MTTIKIINVYKKWLLFSLWKKNVNSVYENKSGDVMNSVRVVRRNTTWFPRCRALICIFIAHVQYQFYCTPLLHCRSLILYNNTMYGQWFFCPFYKWACTFSIGKIQQYFLPFGKICSFFWYRAIAWSDSCFTLIFL